MLYEIYEIRKSSYPILRSRKDSLDDFITEYLKTKVVEVWPQGWVKYEDLKKEIFRKEKKMREDPAKSHNNNNNNLNNNNDKHQSKLTETAPQQQQPQQLQQPQQQQPKQTTPPATSSHKDMTSPGRRTDHSIISIMSLTSPSSGSGTASSKNHSQQNDIQSSAPLIKMETAPEPQTISTVRRNSSGSDSDGVEIVGVYNAPSLPKKPNLLNVNRQSKNPNKSRSNSPMTVKKSQPQPMLHEDIEAQIDNNCSFKGLMTALKDLDVIDLS